MPSFSPAELRRSTPRSGRARFAGVLAFRRRAFPRCIGVPVAKVRDWESGKQAPAGPERMLPKLIAHSPRTVRAALGG